MPRQFNWTRDGRTLLADGEAAFYLEPCRNRGNNGPIAPYEADCVAMQLHNALSRGIIGVPSTLTEYDELKTEPKTLDATSVLDLARALINAIDNATPRELATARATLKVDGFDLSQSAARRRYARVLRQVLEYAE